MKRLLTLLLFSCLGAVAYGQCYQPLRGEGQTLMQKKNYEEAINRYLAALNCPDRPRDNDLPQLIKAALRARVEELEAARRKTEEALALARRREKEARAAALAAKARQIFPDDQTLGLRLAGEAYLLDPAGQEPAAALADFFQEPECYFYQAAFPHAAEVEPILFFPDGKRVLTAALDSTARIWTREGALLHTLPHPAGVTCADLTPDGALILTGSYDGKVRKWSAAGELLATFGGFEGGQEGIGITDIAITPGGKSFFAGTFGGPLQLLDLEGTVVLHFGNVQVSELAVAPDGQSFLICGGDENAYHYDFEGNLLRTFEGHTSFVSSVAFSPGGELVLTAGQDGTARVWSPEGGAVILEGHEGMVRDAVFSPDGELVLTAAADKRIRVFHHQGQLLRTYRGHQDLVSRLAFSPDGKYFLSASFEGAAKLWPVNGEVSRPLTGHRGSISAVDFSPDGQYVLTAARDSTLKLWTARGSFVRNLLEAPAGIPSAAFSPDGSEVLIVEGSHVVRAIDLAGQETWRAEAPSAMPGGYYSQAVFAPDGRQVLTANTDGTATLLDRDGKVVRTYRGHKESVASVAFAPDGAHLLTGSFDGQAVLWSREGKEIARVNAPAGHFFTRVAFSPDGQFFLTGSSNGRVQIWDLEGTLVRTLEGLWDGILSLECSPDRSFVLAAGVLGPAKMWTFAGKELQSAYPRGIRRFVTCAAFSPDGKTIAIGDSENEALLFLRWDELLRKVIPPLTEKQRTDFGLAVQNE